VYPGFVDTGAAQVSYYIGAHTGYAGLYTNASLTAQGELYAIGNIFSNSPVYPGRIDTGWTKQTSLYLGSHGSYGLYSNTGLYLEGPVWMSSFASRGPGTIAGNLTITTGGASITGTLVVNTVVVNVGPLTVATGGADITGYSYVRTPGGAGDASLFLMNPAAGGATQNFRLMSYGGYFRVWNADNGAELLLVHGSGSVTLPGGGGVMSAQVYYERGRTVPMGGLTAVDPAVYMHGQVVGVSGTMMYALVGRMMHLTFNIAATCVTGGGNQINMTIPFPAGQLPAITCHVGIWTAHAQRYWHSSFAAYAANQYFLTFYDEGLAGWPDGAIYLYGSIDIPFSP
jgi:hypothetical protein